MIPLSWRGRTGVHGPEFDKYLKTKVSHSHSAPTGSFPDINISVGEDGTYASSGDGALIMARAASLI